jgi:SRSO17 transposase
MVGGMTPQALKALETRLERLLRDLTEPMGRRERRQWAQVYVQGLLLDGDRNSIEPMASRLPGADVQALRQFVGQSPWAVDTGQRRLALKAVDRLSDADVWILDETACPKAGTPSVGVARQYCGTLGKVANCQVAVSWHGSRAEARCPRNWRLYLPKAWGDGPQRAAHVRVPPGTPYRSKTAWALDLIDQVRRWEGPARPLVADASYGNDFGFRQALRPRQLACVVEVEASTGAWTEAPNVPLPPPKKTGRPRRYPPLEALPRPRSLHTVAQELPPAAWESVIWRAGSRGPQRSRFGLTQGWASHGWREQYHPERGAEWLLVEGPRGAPAPVKYWLAHFEAPLPGLQRVVRLAQSRWRIALDYRELKEALGLDHCEGRHGLGWHHHVCLVRIAYAFVRAEQARVKQNAWCDLAPGEEAPASPAH